MHLFLPISSVINDSVVLPQAVTKPTSHSKPICGVVTSVLLLIMLSSSSFNSALSVMFIYSNVCIIPLFAGKYFNMRVPEVPKNQKRLIACEYLVSQTRFCTQCLCTSCNCGDQLEPFVLHFVKQQLLMRRLHPIMRGPAPAATANCRCSRVLMTYVTNSFITVTRSIIL